MSAENPLTRIVTQTAYAKLERNNTCYYIVHSLQKAVIGREDCKDVNVSLGNGKHISPRHAEINYNRITKNFEITVLNRIGIRIDGSPVATAGATIPLKNNSIIQICCECLKFVLPEEIPVIDDDCGFTKTLEAWVDHMIKEKGIGLQQMIDTYRFTDVEPLFPLYMLIMLAITEYKRALTVGEIAMYILRNFPFFRSYRPDELREKVLTELQTSKKFNFTTQRLSTVTAGVIRFNGGQDLSKEILFKDVEQSKTRWSFAFSLSFVKALFEECNIHLMSRYQYLPPPRRNKRNACYYRKAKRAKKSNDNALQAKEPQIDPKTNQQNINSPNPTKDLQDQPASIANLTENQSIAQETIVLE